MSDVATYVINSKSGITGTGTINKFPIFTASTIIGDSIITQAALGQGITVGGNLDVTNDTNLQGSLLADSLEVTNDSIFIGSARFNGTIKDTSGGVGTNGQVLTSTGTGVAWTTDAGGSVTGTGTTNYIAKWNTSSSIQDSIIFDNGTNVGIGTNTPNFLLDVEAQGANIRVFNLTSDANTDVYIRTTGTAGSSKILFGDSADPDVGNIIYRHNSNSLAFATNNSEKMRITSDGNTGIGTTTPQAKLHVNGSAFLVTQGNETGLDINNDTYIYKIGDISGGENQAYMQIDSAASKAFFLNSNVGIGTNSPTQKLQVEGNIYAGGSIRIEDNGDQLEFGNANVALQRSVNFLELGGYDGIIFKSSNATLDSQSERMRITSTGNVGIGTTSPSAKLQVSSSGDTVVKITSANGNGAFLDLGDASDTDGGRIVYDSGSNLALYTASSERMRIKNNGRVGIGTTNPVYELDVSGEIRATSEVLWGNNNNSPVGRLYAGAQIGVMLNTENDGAIVVSGGNATSAGGNITLYGGTHASQANEISFRSGGTNTMLIDSSGNVGIGTASPGQKLDVAGNIVIQSGGSSSDSNYISMVGSRAIFGYDGSISSAYMRSSDTSKPLVFGSASSEFMRIVSSSGNVGIGTTSPSQKLEISEGYISSSGAGTSHGFELKRSGLDTYRLRHLDSGLTVFNDTDGRKEMTFDGTGNVGIGTGSPGSKLQVDGGDIEVDDSANGLILRSPNGTRYRVQVDNSGNLTRTAI
jgi:hypothetical protein